MLLESVTVRMLQHDRFHKFKPHTPTHKQLSPGEYNIFLKTTWVVGLSSQRNPYPHFECQSFLQLSAQYRRGQVNLKSLQYTVQLTCLHPIQQAEQGLTIQALGLMSFDLGYRPDVPHHVAVPSGKRVRRFQDREFDTHKSGNSAQENVTQTFQTP